MGPRWAVVGGAFALGLFGCNHPGGPTGTDGGPGVGPVPVSQVFQMPPITERLHPVADAGPSPIAIENQQPGDPGWDLKQYDPAMGAFTDRPSYLPGDTVHVFAAAGSSQSASWELWRMGYYGGTGGRKVLSGGPFDLPQAASAVMDSTTGMVRAPWSEAFSFAIPQNAVTGIYLLRLSGTSGQTYAILVVREPKPKAAIFYPVALNTYQAYNDWGGTSLYVNQRSEWPNSHAFAVSFERPFKEGAGTGDFFLQDQAFLMFAEGQGYDIGYATDVDLDADPTLVNGRSMLLVQGHSEYWSAGMRGAAEAAIAQGVNAAFLGANDIYWQVRYAPGSDGTPRRVMIGYKEFAAQDPDQTSNPALVTTRWRDPPVNRPENAILGQMFGSWIAEASPFVITAPSSWLWTGANVQAGTIIPGVFGDEVDNRHDNGAEPAGVAELGHGAVMSQSSHLTLGQSTLYTAPSGALVFDAGSIRWSRTLAYPGMWDPRMQQFAANLFSRFAGNGVLGAAALRPLQLPAGAPTPTWLPGVTVSTVTQNLTAPMAVAALGNGDAVVADGDRIVEVTPSGTVTVLAGSTSGDADGPAASAQFSGPQGLAVAANGTLYVSDTQNNKIKAISNGTVTTLAGSSQGFAEGTGSAAQFSTPEGIALTPSGVLLVADSWNQRIRAVTPSGSVSTWAGNGQRSVIDGNGTSASVLFPSSIISMSDGTALFLEPDTGELRTLAESGSHAVSAWMGEVGREGWEDGPTSTASISQVISLAPGKNGDVILLDAGSGRVRVVRSGTVSTLAGGAVGGTVDGPGAQAGFAFPVGAALAPDGSLYVIDAAEHSLRRITY